MSIRYKKILFEIDTSLFLKDKYARKITLNLYYKNGDVLVKQNGKYISVGNYNEITLDDFLEIKNMRKNWVYTENIINKIYKLIFDIDKLKSFTKLNSTTLVDDINYLITFISHLNEDTILYNIALTSYDDISTEILLKKFGKKYESKKLDEFDFLILETSDLYPNQLNYRLTIK